MRMIILISIIFSQSWRVKSQADMPVDTLVNQFERVKKICNKDNGKLWGINLYGPILIIDENSKTVIANEQDSLQDLEKIGNVYVGKYPSNTVVAYSSVDWAGKSWVTMAYPFAFKDTSELYRCYVHESFHRIQKELGLDCGGYNNPHMDNMDARIYLNLEWEALLSAIISTDNNRIIAIKDALLFRQQRRMKYLDAESMESKFEIHEGLAEYTGYKLYYNTDEELMEGILQCKSKFLDNDVSNVRRFGYFSGLLYGYLLDKTNTLWRKNLKCEDDLGKLLKHALKIDISNDTTNWFNSSKNRYPYDEIYKKQLARNNNKEEILSDYRIRFTKDPVLVIDLITAGLGMKSSPHPLDTIGDVYPKLEITDNWGFLSVIDKGCLLGNKKAIVTANNIKIKGKEITGDGWKLGLNENWILVKQDENYLIKPKISQ